LALISLDDIEQGQAYSPQAQAVKPFGDRHRTILLDFLGDRAIRNNPSCPKRLESKAENL
jgi:hypothetical protein